MFLSTKQGTSKLMSNPLSISLHESTIQVLEQELFLHRQQPFFEYSGERGGLVVNASDSGFKGRGFEPHSGKTVLCPWARHIYSQNILVIPRKRWLCPNMTENLFTGNQLTINTYRQHSQTMQDTVYYIPNYDKRKILIT